MTLVALDGVGKSFGGLQAVRDVSFRVQPGEIFSVIGPNGSGKSTLFNLITGVLPPTAGTIMLFGHDVRGLGPDRIAGLGLGRTFQTTQVFAERTVLENVLAGRHLHVRTGLWGALLRTGAFREQEARHQERSLDILAQLGLGGVVALPAGTLSNAWQQRVAIAMALATEPKLLLLDEPTGGLMEQEVLALMELLREIRDRGVTVMLIEHKMRLVRQVSDRIAVLNNGTLICLGTPETVLSDDRVVEAYLGTAEHAAA